VTPILEVHPAAAWADAVAAALTDRLRAEPRLRLCLPTGETPAPLYAALSGSTDADLWSQATVVLLDEYLGLGPDDPAAGGPRLRRELIDHVRPSAFHAVEPDAEPDAAARQLDAVAADGLDLTLLGLGLNGHIGLNEPGSTADSPTRVVELEARSQAVAEGYGASHAPERGITLGLSRLLESREIWLLVTGERKAEVLRRALKEPEGPDCPASYLRRHSSSRVIADEPAARLLRDTMPG
jgi:glucosamine-6-phosphate deaminase